LPGFWAVFSYLTAAHPGLLLDSNEKKLLCEMF